VGTKGLRRETGAYSRCTRERAGERVAQSQHAPPAPFGYTANVYGSVHAGGKLERPAGEPDRAGHLAQTVRVESAAGKSRLVIQGPADPAGNVRCESGPRAEVLEHPIPEAPAAEKARPRADAASRITRPRNVARMGHQTTDAGDRSHERAARNPNPGSAETVRTWSVLELGAASETADASPAAVTQVLKRGAGAERLWLRVPSSTSAHNERPAGGTGRRGRLKIGGPECGRVGSTPTPGTGAVARDLTSSACRLTDDSTATLRAGEMIGARLAITPGLTTAGMAARVATSPSTVALAARRVEAGARGWLRHEGASA
jgi:hypothetical protein